MRPWYAYGATALLVLATSACVTAPVTPLTESGHAFGQEEDEKKLIKRSDEADAELRRRGLVLQDAQIDDYVLGVARRPGRPRIGSGDRPVDCRVEFVVEGSILGVEQDAPPERSGGEHVAGFRRRGTAGAFELLIDLVEPRVENAVVGAHQALDSAQRLPDVRLAVHPEGAERGGGSGRAAREPCRSRGAAAAGHVMLVRRVCFSL